MRSGTKSNEKAAMSSAVSIIVIVIIAAIASFALWQAGLSVTEVSQSTSASSSTSQGSTSSAANAIRVTIVEGSGTNQSSHGYSPDNITVVIGVNSTVVWINSDSAPHTATANDKSFDSGNLNSGQASSFTFTKPGTYQYHCNYHNWMSGKVIVKSS